MRRFHSYGPVDCQEHFCVGREELVRQCRDQLMGGSENGGHYFTVWAPRQTGKTWLVRQVKKSIEALYPERFEIGMMSVQGIVMGPDDPETGFLSRLPLLFWEAFKIEMDNPPTGPDEFKNLFLKDKGLFHKPLILFIDEFDSLPRHVIDFLVTLFRDMYLKRESYLLHGLALIGVRAVLGVESERGSPFNIQRSLHVPNFTPDEVARLFDQYRQESGQSVDPPVVRGVYDATRGQPGLVCWFGELLTTSYNPGAGGSIDAAAWKMTYHKARHSEWNNSILNLIRKARARYRERVLRLFSRSDMMFSLDADWCAYLYLNGIIRPETVTDEQEQLREVCRFASPFIQERIYNALTMSLVGDELPLLALDPLDSLSDVFDGPEPDLPALLERYKNFLRRLEAGGIDPWKEQPRRADLHLTEAVGHFHLYAWLREAVKGICVVSPEFPTGDGKVDLHLRCGDKMGVIEVKSFENFVKTQAARAQAAGYAETLGLKQVTVALFVPVRDDEVLRRLSGETRVGDVRVWVVAIGWG